MKARLQSQGIYRNVLMITVLAGLGGFFVAGCESRDTTENKAEISRTESFSADAVNSDKQEAGEPLAPEIVYEKGPAPTPETVLASGKGVKVTLAEYDRAMHRSLLYAPPKEDGSRYLENPAERLAAPQLQRALLEHLLGNVVIFEEAEKRGLQCETKDVREAMLSQRQTEKYAVLFNEGDALKEHPDLLAELAVLSLTPEDLREMACEDVLRTKLQTALLEDIDDAELWAAYEVARNTVDLLMVAVNNTPSSVELDAFLEQDSAKEEPQIDAHFAKYPERYMLPRVARLTILKPPAGQGGPEIAEKLQQAVHRLSSGEEPAAIASGLGLVLEDDGEVHAGENPRVFGTKVGGTGMELEGPRGAYAWRLEGVNEPVQLELTRPLRREIAADLLREKGVLDSVSKKLQPALEEMKALGTLKKGESVSEEKIEALREKLAVHDLKLTRTSAFPRTQQGFIPGIGLAEEVMEAAFALSEEKPTMSALISSRDRVFAFRLVARERPSRAGFAKEKSGFRKSYVAGQENQVVPNFTAAKFAAAEITVDPSALRIKYGTMGK